MGTTDTRDVMATVEQAMRVADNGGDLFRITVQVCGLVGGSVGAFGHRGRGVRYTCVHLLWEPSPSTFDI